MSGDNFNKDSIDAVLSRIETKLDAAMKIQEKHGSAIEALNQWKWWLTGIAAAISIGASKAVEIITGKQQ
jgi:hypothetical protein